MLTAPPAAAAPAPTNLVAHWAIDENGGTSVANAASTSYGGSFFSTPSWTPGRLGAALAFDGTDYVQMGNIAPINGVQKLSLAGWVRRNAAGAIVVLGKQNSGANVGIYAHSSGAIRFYVSSGSSAYGSITLNDTAWHHVALVFDGALSGNANRLKGYVDGVQKTLSFSGTVGATTTTDTTPFRLGRWGNTYSTGAIDDVWLFARVLTLAEIQDLAQFTPDTLPPNPPTGLTAGLVTATSAAFTWTAATDNVGIVGYDIYRNGAQIGTTTGLAYSDTTLAPTTAYSYTIKAYDAAGLRSDFSAPLNIATNAIVPGAAFPLHMSADERYLEDGNGNPFIMRGEAAWSLIAGPDNAGVVQYLDDRKAKGVNAIIVNLVEHFFNGPTDAYGNNPFTTTGDFTTPNEAYFAHADYVIRQAEQRGILVLLLPAYLGWQGGNQGWYTEVNANGAAKMLEYGRYIGNRYRNYTNILWTMGGDHGPHAALDEIRAMVQGIKETAGAQTLFTVHSGQGSSFNDGYSISVDTWVDLDNLYYYSDCRLHAQLMQQMYNRTPNFGFFFIEGHYENESSSALCRREQDYWPPLVGGTGYFFGVTPVWNFDPGWPSALQSAGSQDLRRASMLFASRPYYFTPAQNALTAGAATGANFVSAGRSPNGETLIVYTPDQHALTIDMTKVGGANAQAWWYNPRTDGAPTNLGSFPTTGTRSFTPPASGDWALVLDNSALGLPPPGTVAPPAPDNQAPSQPGAPIIGTATQSSIALTWTPSTDNVGVTRYKVFRDDAEIGTTPSAAYTDNIGLSPGTTYSYKVQAFDAANNPSAFSASTPGATAAAQCGDGADNDSDNLVDYPADPGCVSATDNDESNPDLSPPTAPGDLAASNITQTSLTLAWGAASDNTGVTAYHVLRNDSDIATVTTGTGFNDSGLAPGTSFKYQISAWDAANNHTESAPLNVSTLTPPPPQCNDAADNDGDGRTDFPDDPGCTSANDDNETDPAPDGEAPTIPTGLSASNVTQTTLTLSWTPSTDNVAVTGYSVLRDDVDVGTPTGASFNDSGLSAGVSYAYKVLAHDLAGNESEASGPLNVTTAAPDDTTPPTAPANLQASSLAQTSLTLSWTAATDNVGVTLYRVYRNGTEIGAPSGTSFNVTGLTVNTTYSFTVRAFDARQNQSDPSTALVVTTPDQTAPSVPTGLQASSVAQTTLTLSWTASTDNVGVARYFIYRNGTKLTAEPTTASLNDTGLTAGTAYTYRVAAIDAAGNTSNQSTVLNVTTAPPPDMTLPTAPTNLQASNVAQTTLTLAWTAATDNVAVARYRIFRNAAALPSEPTTTSFNDSGLTAGTAYTYTVAAIDTSSNVGPQSTQLNVTTAASGGGGAANLIAAYSFNDGTARNVAGTSYNGTFAGTPTFTAAGRHGGALVFDGTDAVEIGNITQINGATQVTVEAWMKRASAGARVLIGKQTTNHDVSLEFWSSGTVDLGTSNGAWAYGTFAINDTAWHHVALVFDGSLSGNANRLKLYVDGAPKTLNITGTIPATTTTNTTPFRLGRIQSDYSNGAIDEVRIYNRALSITDVQNDMNAPLP